MQRLVGLLGAEVAAGLVEVVVVEVPQQRRPALVELPVDDARRGRVLVGRVVDVGLELGPLRLVVLDLGLLHVLAQARPRAVAVGDRRIEVVERAERVAAVVRSRQVGLVVGVVLVVVGVLPQLVLLERRQEPLDRVERGDRVAGARLGVERPGAADVGAAGVARVVVRGVVPVARRHPVVRALLLARRASCGAALVLSRGDQRVLEVGLLEALQRYRLLAPGRLVVAPAEVQDAGVVAQVLADRQRRELQDREVVVARSGRCPAAATRRSTESRRRPGSRRDPSARRSRRASACPRCESRSTRDS